MYKNGKAVVGAVLTGQHVGVGTIRNGENVGWDFISPPALVDLNHTVGVDGVALVGIDGDAEQAGVGLIYFVSHPYRNRLAQIIRLQLLP